MAEPLTRRERYYAAMAGSGEPPSYPLTREEEFLQEIIDSGGGSGGTDNYNALSNKPKINGTTLTGDKTAADLGLLGEDDELTAAAWAAADFTETTVAALIESAEPEALTTEQVTALLALLG